MDQKIIAHVAHNTTHPTIEYTTVNPGLRDLFGIGKSRGWQLLSDGKIRGRKFGNRTLVECASVREFMTSLPTAR
jgi:hypothetical protein